MQNERRKWKSAALVAALAVALLALAPPARAETYWSAKDGMPWPWNPGWPALWLSNSPSGEHHLLLDNDQAVVATAQGLLSGAIATESLDEDPPTPPGGGGGGGEPEPEPFTNKVVRIFGSLCYSNLNPFTWGLIRPDGTGQSWLNWCEPSPPIYEGSMFFAAWTNPCPEMMTNTTAFTVAEITTEFDGTNYNYLTNLTDVVEVPCTATNATNFMFSILVDPVTYTEVVTNGGMVGYSNYTTWMDVERKWTFNSVDPYRQIYDYTNANFTNWTASPILFDAWIYAPAWRYTNINNEFWAVAICVKLHLTEAVGRIKAWQAWLDAQLFGSRDIAEFLGSPIPEPPPGKYVSPNEVMKHKPGDLLNPPTSKPVYFPPQNHVPPPRPLRDGVPDYDIYIITNAPPDMMFFTGIFPTNGWTYTGTNYWTGP